MTLPCDRRRARPAPAAFVLLALALLLLGATGCQMGLGVATEVEPDGSGVTRLDLSVDQDLQAFLESEVGGEDLFSGFEESLGEDWQVQVETAEDGSRRLVATQPFAEPDQLPLSGGMPEAGGLLRDVRLEQSEGMFTTMTRFTARFDPVAALNEIGAERPQDINPGLVSSVLRLENRLRLPGRLGEHNGEAVEDGFVVWRPPLTEPVTMRAESTLYHWWMIGLLALLGVAVLAGVAFAAVRVGRARS